MGSSENFCLRWNDFETNVSGAFRELRAESDFFDVTLACDESQGRTLQAHRVILSACSTFFKQMLRNTLAASPGHPNPLIYLRGTRLVDLESILDFMYHGEVNVAQEDLTSFLAVAEDLQIKGLTQQNTKDLGGRKGGRKSTMGGGSAAKRSRKDHDLNLDDKDIKREVSGYDGASTSAGGMAVTGYDDASAAAHAFDESYDGYGYDDTGNPTTDTNTTAPPTNVIDPSSMTTTPGLDPEHTKAVTDLNELVLGLLTYQDGIHTCNLCGKKSPWRTTMLRHIEANHVETAGHICDICGQVSKTRHAFAMHKKRKHKVNIANEPLPDRTPKQDTQQQQQQQQQQQTLQPQQQHQSQATG